VGKREPGHLPDDRFGERADLAADLHRRGSLVRYRCRCRSDNGTGPYPGGGGRLLADGDVGGQVLDLDLVGAWLDLAWGGGAEAAGGEGGVGEAEAERVAGVVAGALAGVGSWQLVEELGLVARERRRARVELRHRRVLGRLGGPGDRQLATGVDVAEQDV